MNPIQSPQNERFKKAMKLHTSRGRRKQDRIIVFGSREVARAREAGVWISELMIDAEKIKTGELTALVDSFNSGASNAPKTEIYQLAKPLFSKLAYGDRVDGVVGIAPRPDVSLAGLESKNVHRGSLFIILEGIEKPGNLGAIARSADACGADAILIADPQTDVFHPNAIRSSMGCVFSVPIAVTSSAEVQSWLGQHGIEVFVGTPEAEKNIYQTDLRNPVAFVFGTEGDGLSQHWRGGDWSLIKLPMRGIADSLNVSVTASVMMFETKRQQDGSSGVLS